MRRLASLLTASSLCLLACNKQETQTQTTASATTEAVKDEEQKPIVKDPVKVETGPTCDSLGIPSYDLWIRDLSALRCESCHNNKVAFNGIKFLTYEDFQTYADAAKVRIETNKLTTPLDPIEQGIFLKWFANGMPRTEKDCASKP